MPAPMPAPTPAKTPSAPNPAPGSAGSKPLTAPNIEPVSVKALRAGDSLVVNQRLTSPNGKYWLVLEKDGPFRLKNISGTVWEADYDLEPFLDLFPPSSVELRPNGKLAVLQKTSDQVIQVWTSENWTGKNTQDTVLIVQDDGHAAILSNGERLWYTYRQKDSSTNRDRLVAGEWLAVGQALISPSGKLSLVLQSNGDFVLSKGSEKLWTKSVPGDGAFQATVKLRDDDNLWIDWGDQVAWTSQTRRKMNGGNAVLRVADTEGGGAAVLESDGLIIWSTKSSLIQKWEPQKPVPVDPKSDSVRSGQYLPLNQNLCSADNEFCAFLKPDGIYIQRLKVDSDILYSFKPDSKVSLSRLWLGLDGKLVLVGENSVKVWESKTTTLESGSALVMQGNGNLVLTGLKSGSWSSGSVFPATNNQIDRLKGGESLLLNQNILSQNGTWSLSFTTEAHFAIQNTTTKVSTYYYTRPFQKNARMLTRSISGNLEVRGSPDLQLKWSSLAQKAGSTTEATVIPKEWFIMQDDGSAVLYVGGVATWNSSSRPRGSSPTQISDRLISNTTDSNAMLKLGQGIISPNGEFHLWLKLDGDFELNSKNGRRLWNSGTSGKPGVDSVILNSVGNLMVYVSKEKRFVWQSRDNVKSKYPDALNAELVIQDNGSVVIMSSGKVVWTVWQMDSK